MQAVCKDVSPCGRGCALVGRSPIFAEGWVSSLYQDLCPSYSECGLLSQIAATYGTNLGKDLIPDLLAKREGRP